MPVKVQKKTALQHKAEKNLKKNVHVRCHFFVFLQALYVGV